MRHRPNRVREQQVKPYSEGGLPCLRSCFFSNAWLSELLEADDMISKCVGCLTEHVEAVWKSEEDSPGFASAMVESCRKKVDRRNEADSTCRAESCLEHHDLYFITRPPRALSTQQIANQGVTAACPPLLPSQPAREGQQVSGGSRDDDETAVPCLPPPSRGRTPGGGGGRAP